MDLLGIDLVEWTLLAVGLVLAAIIYVRRIKTYGPPHYAPASQRQKAVCLVLIVGMLATWAIDFAGWRPFRGYEKQVATIVSILGVLYVTRLTAILERR